MNIFKALNEKIEGMGYSYSMASFFKNFISVSIGIVVLGYFHKLDVIYIVALIVAYFMLLPFSIFYQYKYLYEQKRFQNLCVYLKQMKANFKAYKKILIALEETSESFSEDDEILKYIEEAISEIKKGTSYRDSLNIIENKYKNSFITKLHSYMILGEMEGGNAVLQALENIDFEEWRTDTYIFQTQKYKYHSHNGYYTLFGLSMSLGVVLILQEIINVTNGVMNNMFVTNEYQIYTFLYILIVMVSYIFIKSVITAKWVREDE